jgi:hypothetical protein
MPQRRFPRQRTLTPTATPERRLLLQFIEQHEARVARLEELKIKKALEGLDEIDWDAEREEVYQRLLKATADVQLPPQANE